MIFIFSLKVLVSNLVKKTAKIKVYWSTCIILFDEGDKLLTIIFDEEWIDCAILIDPNQVMSLKRIKLEEY